MDLGWDEAKRRRVLAERGLDFADAWMFFDGRPVVLTPSPRFGEERVCATADIEGRFLTLVFTWRGEMLRVITMRRSHAKEERQYRQIFSG